jgi:SMI1/KNR4 family protein SUKH-1
MSDAGLHYLQGVAEILAPAIAEAPGSLVACSDEEIAALEQLVAPHRLPAAYVELLRYGGKQLGPIFRGVDFSYRMALAQRSHGNRDILKMLRVWDKTAALPETLFVLNEHLGSNFTYFDLGEGDDPPVYLWEEGDGGLDTAVREHERFSDFVLAQAKNAMKIGRAGR